MNLETICEVFGLINDRWMLWRWKGKPNESTKIPQSLGEVPGDGKTNDPGTWGSLFTGLTVLEDPLTDGMNAGLAIVLGQVSENRWLVGVDLDLARDAKTGAIEPWAQEAIKEFNSYTEISPSGTGFKIYGYLTSDVCLDSKEIPMGPEIQEPKGGHSQPEKALYSWGRFFCVTGEHYPGTPLELRDVTAAWLDTLNRHGGAKTVYPKRDISEDDVVPGDGTLPDSVFALFEREPELGDLFFAGKERLDGKTEKNTGSDRDFALVTTLVKKGVPEVDALKTLWAYTGGQFDNGNGKEGGSRSVRRAARIWDDLPPPKTAAEDEFEVDLGEWSEEVAQKAAKAIPAPARPKEDWECILDEVIAEMNQRFFVVSVKGDELIASVEYDDALKREHVVYRSRESLKLKYNHRHYKWGVYPPSKQYPEGRDKILDLGTLWVQHRDRRNYERITMQPKGETPPGVFNLWRGLGVQPKEGPWSTIHAHLFDVICGCNQEHYDWLESWMAFCVQYPEKQAGSAVVLRGGKGVGKSWVGRIMMEIFRHHAMAITNSRHLTGNFNAHLANVVFLFADEAFYAGDKAGENVLKGLITEPTLSIEPKGVDSFMVPNYLKILMASNAEWVVPVTEGERRFFMLDVSDSKKYDTSYFDRLAEAVKKEVPCFLDHLLKKDLSGWNRYAPPHTASLNDQKFLGASSFGRFWFDSLYHGSILGVAADFNDGWQQRVSTTALYNAYCDYARKHGFRHPAGNKSMGKELKKYMPGGKLEKSRPGKGDGDVLREREYHFADLDTMRLAFLRANNVENPEEFDWDDGAVND